MVMTGCWATCCTDPSAEFVACMIVSVETGETQKECFSLVDSGFNPNTGHKLQPKSISASVHVCAECTNLLVLQECLTHAGAVVQLSL